MDLVESIAIEFDLKNRTFKQIDLHELVMDMKDPNKVYWVHCDLRQQNIFKLLCKKLQLPEDIVTLCKLEDILPKSIDTDDSLTVQIQSLVSTELNKRHEPTFGNLILYLTHKFCFTASDEYLQVLSEFIHDCPKAIHYAQTPCFILFLILDGVVNDYAKILFKFEEVTEELDIRIHKTHKNIYYKVMDVKLHVMKVKRYTIAMREILMRISGHNIAVVSAECRASLSNLSNHAHMIAHEADSIRDMLNGLLDGMENSLMQKMNETMRVLTAFAAIFLPLTLITGIYGMNFHWIPELNWKYGYFGALALILVCGIGLFLVFKKKKWF